MQAQFATILFACLLIPGSLACGEVDGEPDAISDPVERFCADYDETCGFANSFGGQPYTDLGNCKDRFESFNTARRDCTTEQLSFAQSGNPPEFCPAVEGGDPCDARSTFCVQYGITCGFANSRGGVAYTDMNDCLTRYDAFSATRQMCVQLHLGFAEEGDPDLHCPHVEGAAPCN